MNFNSSPPQMADRLERCERSRQHTLDISNLELTDWPSAVSSFFSILFGIIFSSNTLVLGLKIWESKNLKSEQE
jgi:hypothetical protein